MNIPKITNYAKKITQLTPEMVMRRHPDAVVKKMSKSADTESLKDVLIEVETKFGSLIRFEFDRDKKFVSKTVDKIISAEKSRFKEGYHLHISTENCSRNNAGIYSTNTSIYAEAEQGMYIKKIYQLRAKIKDIVSKIITTDGNIDFSYREVNYRSSDSFFNNLSNKFYHSNKKIKIFKTPKGKLKFVVDTSGKVTAQYKQGRKLISEFQNDKFEGEFQDAVILEVQKLEALM